MAICWRSSLLPSLVRFLPPNLSRLLIQYFPLLYLFFFFLVQLGAYRVDVLNDGKSLRGSPFSCQAYDPTKVEIDNVKSTNVTVHESITFQSNLRSHCFYYTQ